MSECKEISGCDCIPQLFEELIVEAPSPEVVEEIEAELSGLRWELPCTSDEGLPVCNCDAGVEVSATLSGDTTRTYQVSLQFRGRVESKTYIGGTNDGSRFQIGGTPANDTFNWYSLEVSNPAAIYYLNRSVGGPSGAQVIDYTKTIPIKGGATVTLRAASIDGKEYGNTGMIVVPGVPPAPLPYIGQFIQMDVVGIA